MVYGKNPSWGRLVFAERLWYGKKTTGRCNLTRIELLKLIRRFPDAAPITDRWWSTDHHPNKKHWLDWLEEYGGAGYYNRRRPSAQRGAMFIYNHLHCPPMLSWLAEQAQVPGKVLEAACKAAGP